MKKYVIICLLITTFNVNALEAYAGFYGGSNNAPNVVNGEYSNWANAGGLVGISYSYDNGFYIATDVTLNNESPVVSLSLGMHVNDFIGSIGIGYSEETINHNTGFSTPFDPYIEKHDSYNLFFLDLEKAGFFARYSMYNTRYSDLQRRVTDSSIIPITYEIRHFYSKTKRNAIMIGYRLRFK